MISFLSSFLASLVLVVVFFTLHSLALCRQLSGVKSLRFRIFAALFGVLATAAVAVTFFRILGDGFPTQPMSNYALAVSLAGLVIVGVPLFGAHVVRGWVAGHHEQLLDLSLEKSLSADWTDEMWREKALTEQLRQLGDPEALINNYHDTYKLRRRELSRVALSAPVLALLLGDDDYPAKEIVHLHEQRAAERRRRFEAISGKTLR